MSAVKQAVDKYVDDYTVAIFSKTFCPYCKKAKATIKELEIDASKIKIVEIDEDPQGGDIQAYLAEKTGQRTVPNIFINKTHVGGNDDFQSKVRNGTVKKLLAGTA